MKSTLQFKLQKDMANAAASAKNAATRLDVLGTSNKVDIQHQYDYMCCGFWLKGHKYTIYDNQKNLMLTGLHQQPQRSFRPSSNDDSCGPPLQIYQYSQEPLLEMHFASSPDGILDFTPSTVAVTLPSEVLIGSLTKEDKNATTTAILGGTTLSLVIKAFDYDGGFLFLAKPGGKTLAEESIHNVVMDSSRIAKIRSMPGYAVLEYKKDDITPDVRALLLATAIWLEIIERKKPRWQRQGLHLTRS